MSLWSRLFTARPKPKCNYCKDTGVESDGYTARVCRHRDMKAEMRKHHEEFNKIICDAKSAEFARKLGVKP